MNKTSLYRIQNQGEPVLVRHDVIDSRPRNSLHHPNHKYKEQNDSMHYTLLFPLPILKFTKAIEPLL